MGDFEYLEAWGVSEVVEGIVSFAVPLIRVCTQRTMLERKREKKGEERRREDEVIKINLILNLLRSNQFLLSCLSIVHIALQVLGVAAFHQLGGLALLSGR